MFTLCIPDGERTSEQERKEHEQVRKGAVKMSNKEKRENEFNTICPLLALTNRWGPECRGQSCAWWTGDRCAMKDIAWSLDSMKSDQ